MQFTVASNIAMKMTIGMASYSSKLISGTTLVTG